MLIKYFDIFAGIGGFRLRRSSLRWMNWGTMSHGKCLTAQILKSHNPEKECILSDFIEKSVPEKYCLSQTQIQKLLSKEFQAEIARLDKEVKDAHKQNQS